MGNDPIGGVDPNGGWAWETAAIGFAVGAGVAALTGNGDDWWKWGLAGGVLGGASFTKESYTKTFKSYGAGSLGNFDVVKNGYRLTTTPFGSFFFRSFAVPMRYLEEEDDIYRKMRIKAEQDGYGGHIGENYPEALFFGKKGIMTTGARFTYRKNGTKRKRRWNDNASDALPHKNNKYKIHGKWQSASAYGVGQNFEKPELHTYKVGSPSENQRWLMQPHGDTYRKELGIPQFRVVTPTQIILDPGNQIWMNDND